MPRLRELTGEHFGKLVVLARVGTDERGHIWRLRCECGNEVERRTADLMRTRRPPKSCGCLRHVGQNGRRWKHGQSHRASERESPTYGSWSAMIQRCTNPNSVNFADYGGRGITVCERWRDFQAFLADMGERPKGMTLDRENNARGYEPGNCRWATRSEQNRNRRGAVEVSFRGDTLPLVEVAARTGLRYRSLYQRVITKGESIEFAIAALRLRAGRTGPLPRADYAALTSAPASE